MEPFRTSSVAGAYDRWAPGYDTDPNATRDLAEAVLRAAVPEPDGLDVLEIGCGTGLRTLWLAERARSVLALDLSEGMLEVARARVRSPRVDFRRHDLTEPWPAADASFDLVVDALVLEHLPDLAFVFREAARVLRPGGRMVLCELHPARQRAGRQAEFTTSEGEVERVPAFLHDEEEYLDAARAAGLEVEAAADHLDPAAPPDALPRLLSLRLRRPTP